AGFTTSGSTRIPPKTRPAATNMMTMRLTIVLLLEFFSVGTGRGRRGRLLPVPPAAAERLEQRRGVRVARGLRLHQRRLGEVVLALRVQQGEIARATELELLARHFEAFPRGRLGLGLRLERSRVVLEREQDVGDVLEGGENGPLILRESLVVRRLRAALLRPELTRVEDRLQQVRADVPQRGSRAEQVSRPQRSAAVAARQRQLGKHQRLGDADAGVGLPQDRLGLAYVGPLLQQLRGDADRQLLGQNEITEV